MWKLGFSYLGAKIWRAHVDNIQARNFPNFFLKIIQSKVIPKNTYNIGINTYNCSFLQWN